MQNRGREKYSMKSKGGMSTYVLEKLWQECGGLRTLMVRDPVRILTVLR